MVCQYHRSWRTCGGDAACAARRGADCGLPSATDHAEIVKFLVGAVGDLVGIFFPLLMLTMA